MQILTVGSFGLVGVLCRYALNLSAARLYPALAWPVATAAANVTGSFAMGALYALVMARGGVATPLHTALMTGFLGGFTTFSSFSAEVLQMIQRGAPLQALAYGVGSPVLGLAACAGGYMISKSLLP